MKKLLALALALLLLAASGALAEGQITVYTWEGYFDPDIIGEFTAETGIDVNFSPFASNEEMLAKVQAGGAYDIVLASDYALSVLRKGGYLLPLDMDALDNYKNLNPIYLNQYFDPDGAFTIPYAPGAPTIVYNPDMVEGEITGFADLFDAQFKDGLCLLDDARVMIGAINRMLGYSMNTTDETELAASAAKLGELRDNVRALDSNLPYQYLLSGEVKAAYLFTSYAVICQQENPNLKCVFPAEGIGFGIDAMVIPASSENPAGAHEFLNFLMRPEIAARTAAWTLYFNPNAAADDMLSEELRSYTALNIPEELLDTKEFVEDVGEYESNYQDIWSNFKLS